MRKIATLAGVAALGLGAQANAYDAVADVTFAWANDGTEQGWTSSGAGNALGDISNTSYYVPQGGNNSTSYYNSDFADNAWFLTTACAGGTTFRTQYACKIAPAGSDTSPITDVGPGASASGQLTATDTTLTGTLTVNTTSDEGAGPQLGTTEATGYNVRTADGSPFKNAWYGVNTTATLEVSLTGTFTATNWDIDGGTVKITDSGFQCAFADFSGVLCNPSTTGGGFQANGAAQSWGIDLDGAGTGTTAISEISVYDATTGSGGSLIETISGVLANLTVDGSGNISTTNGEIRRALGSSGGGCLTEIVYNNGAIQCGTLTAATLQVSGTIVPVPAAVWLFGSALGLLGWVRRRV